VTACPGLASVVGEPLAGSASQATRWLLLEVRAPWGRDALRDTELPDGARARLEDWSGAEPGSRVLFIRRPDRREGPLTLVVGRSEEAGGELRRFRLDRLEDLAAADLDAGAPQDGVWLVCTHGRRDPCCARLGRPLYDALDRLLPAEAVWQSSHQGGHRFAANLLVLPHGVQLGRVRPADARSVVDRVGAGAIPLGHYRGRTIHPPPVQAADAAARARHRLVRFEDVRWAGEDGGAHLLDTPAGRLRAVVEAREGPARPESCGAEASASVRYDVELSEPSTARGVAERA
jgi:hypothetical protein